MKKLISVLSSVAMALCVTASDSVSVSAENANTKLTYTDKYGKWGYKLTDSGNAVITGWGR